MKKNYRIILTMFLATFVFLPALVFTHQSRITDGRITDWAEQLSFIASPFGWGLIVIMYVLAFIFGFTYRFILKRLAKGSVRGVSNNIGKPDRLLRLTLGVGLLLWAITTTWSPILIFFSGFAIFEAIFSWCGFYAAIGKSTCPLN